MANITLEAFAAKAVAKVEKFARKTAMDAATGVIMKTPVDTGRARGNWLASMGAPAAGTLETGDKAGNDALMKAAGVANSFRVGQAFYIVNNLPYIKRLEDGWSKQSQAMVSRTVVEIKANWEQVAQALNSQ